MLIHNADITGSLTINGTLFNTGSFSGSFTGTIEGVSATASYVEYTNVANKPTLVSGSSQITYSGLTGIPSGIVSGSSQVTYSGLTGIPSGIVSGSAQVDFAGISNKPTLVSGSSQISFNGIVDKPTLVSGSSQITYSGLTGIPSGIVSGSAQIAGLGYATTSSNTFIGNQTITGSIFGSGSLTIDGCITATGQIVAQTINVQQVTSSIVYSCGSNVFGTSIGNTQQFTGSMFITGSGIRANVGNACFQGSVCANTISTTDGSNTSTLANNFLRSTTGNFYFDACTIGGNFNFRTSNASALDSTALFICGGNNRIGVNCTTPSYPLDIKGTAGTIARITDGTSHITFYAGSGLNEIATVSPMLLTVNGTERVRLDTSGNLLVGSLSAGNAGTINVSVGCAGTTAGGLQLWAATNQTHYLQFGDGTAGAGPYAGYVGYAHSTDSLLFGTATATRAIISSTGVTCFSNTVCAPVAIFSGCVGIGVTSPATKLEIQDAALDYTSALFNGQIITTTPQSIDRGGSFAFGGQTGGGGITQFGAIRGGKENSTFAETGGYLSFMTRANAGPITDKMRITSGGNVGIGTPTPIGKLDVTLLNTRRFIVTYDDSIITIKGASDTGAGENLRIIGDNLIFNTNSVGSGTERLRIFSTGIACFACQVCAASIHASNATNTLGSMQIIASVGGGPSAGITFKPSNASSVNTSYNFELNPSGGAYGFFTVTNVESGNCQTMLQLGGQNLSGDSFINLPSTQQNFSIRASGTPRFYIQGSTGVACFSNTVCAPGFIGRIHQGTGFSSLTGGAGTGNAIYDTITRSGNVLYEVAIVANPNGAGSSSYADFYYGDLFIGTGFSGTAVTDYIVWCQRSTPPRSLYGSGGGNLTVNVCMFYGGAEYSSVGSGGTYTIRFKINGYNSSSTGDGTTIFLKQII